MQSNNLAITEHMGMLMTVDEVSAMVLYLSGSKVEDGKCETTGSQF